MVFSNSIKTALLFVFTLLTFCAYTCGSENSIYIMRRGIDDKTQSQHPNQGTQTGRQFDSASQRTVAAHLQQMQQQQHQQHQLHLHGQLREVFYNQQARVPIANQPQAQRAQQRLIVRNLT